MITSNVQIPDASESDRASCSMDPALKDNDVSGGDDTIGAGDQADGAETTGQSQINNVASHDQPARDSSAGVRQEALRNEVSSRQNRSRNESLRETSRIPRVLKGKGVGQEVGESSNPASNLQNSNPRGSHEYATKHAAFIGDTTITPPGEVQVGETLSNQNFQGSSAIVEREAQIYKGLKAFREEAHIGLTAFRNEVSRRGYRSWSESLRESAQKHALRGDATIESGNTQDEGTRNQNLNPSAGVERGAESHYSYHFEPRWEFSDVEESNLTSLELEDYELEDWEMLLQLCGMFLSGTLLYEYCTGQMSLP